MTQETVTPTPFIKWAGGKTQLLEQYDRFFPSSYNKLVSPFLGGGAVFFRLSPPKAILSDINAKLINVYEQIQKNPIPLMSLLGLFEREYLAGTPEQRKKFYYTARGKFNRADINEIESAALFIFLNKTGFNGLYRENKNGRFNVAWGDGRDVSLFDENNIKVAGNALRHTIIMSGDFQAVMLLAGENDFVYCDPPYIPLNATSFTEYSSRRFEMKDQIRLAVTAKLIAQEGAKVMISQSDTEATRQVYRWEGWHFHEVEARRNINGDGNGRGKIKELVIASYEV